MISTGALAMFDYRRPPEAATTSDLTPVAVHTSDGTIFADGNYVFQVTGSLPSDADLKALMAHLPKVDQTPLPALMTDLPPDDLIADSERYIIGPVSLAPFCSGDSRRRWAHFIPEARPFPVSIRPTKVC